MARSHDPHFRQGAVARRDFLLATAGAAAAGSSLAAHGGRSGLIRVGLIGCGGRGTGAALQAAAADPGVRLVALGDVFSDQVAAAAHVLARDAGSHFDCPVSRRFIGPDAHRRVVDAGVDAVLIAAPPHVRPLHVEAAVTAGCHVFCETPAAADLVGALRVAAMLEEARSAGLTVVSGLHARRDERLVADVERVHSGSIGTPRRVEVRAALDSPWRVAIRPEWSASEARLRNWISDDSLSGGWFVERNVHALDRALWVFGDRLPVIAEPVPADGPAGTGVRYRLTDGAEILAVRAGAPSDAGRERVSGSRGDCELRLAGDGRRFQSTMDAFVAGIRSGRTVDESGILVRSTLVAIMGRTAAASGRPVAWERLVAAGDTTFPALQIAGDVNPGGV